MEIEKRNFRYQVGLLAVFVVGVIFGLFGYPWIGGGICFIVFLSILLDE